VHKDKIYILDLLPPSISITAMYNLKQYISYKPSFFFLYISLLQNLKKNSKEIVSKKYIKGCIWENRNVINNTHTISNKY